MTETIKMKRLKITEKRAIKECKELWEQIHEISNDDKGDFLITSEGLGWLKSHKYVHDCPLCEYASQFSISRLSMDECNNKCPLQKLGGGCTDLGFTAFNRCPEFYENVMKL
jgi:hypothetical protein